MYAHPTTHSLMGRGSIAMTLLATLTQPIISIALLGTDTTLKSLIICVTHSATLSLKSYCKFCHTPFGVTMATLPIKGRAGLEIPGHGNLMWDGCPSHFTFTRYSNFSSWNLIFLPVDSKTSYIYIFLAGSRDPTSSKAMDVCWSGDWNLQRCWSDCWMDSQRLWHLGASQHEVNECLD